MLRIAVLAACLALAPAVSSAQALRLFFIDVEGGQSTLVVTPSGQSLLVDTGWADRQRCATPSASLPR